MKGYWKCSDCGTEIPYARLDEIFEERKENFEEQKEKAVKNLSDFIGGLLLFLVEAVNLMGYNPKVKELAEEIKNEGAKSTMMTLIEELWEKPEKK